MTRKRIIALCISLVVIIGAVLALTLGAFGNSGQANDIKSTKPTLISAISNMVDVFKSTRKIHSDGVKFPVSKIDAVPVSTVMPAGETLPAVGDIETLLKLLKDRGVLVDGSVRNYKYSGWDVEEDMISEAAGSRTASSDPAQPVPSAAPAMGVDGETANSDAGAFSETNEQVAGVSEGDIVKTDGQYIYAMSPYDSKLRIIKAEGAKLEVVSTIAFDGIWGAEFYLIGNDRLAVVGSEYIPMESFPAVNGGNVAAGAKSATDYYSWRSSDFTVLAIYDITDRAAPVDVRRVSMDGWRVSTRVIGDVVYLITNRQLWNIPYDHADSKLILPYCRDTAQGDSFTPVAMDSIYYIPETSDSSYLLVGAVDVYGDEALAPTAYLGAGSNLYMSRGAMYVTKWRWDEQVSGNAREDTVWRGSGEKTDILRFAIDGTNIVYYGMGTVDGSPINQYSMDEYDGYFRIATTDWSTGTYITVIDITDMSVAGRTEPLAPGEQMRSTRFMGEMGYVVTFQNVDPLFTVDLSNPRNPIIKGELKIPGFSQYLHPVGNGMMLGIGRDTQETYTRDSRGVETVIGFRDVGMKASLFDISDPYDPREIDVLALGEGWTEVGNNPRALMCDSSRDLYGFVAETWNNKGNYTSAALLIQVENGRLSVSTKLYQAGYIDVYNSRLCFIGEVLYLVRNTGITAYNYNTYEIIGGVEF